MANFDINWIDDNGIERTNTLTVEENLVRMNLHPKTRVNGSKYNLIRRHKFLHYTICNTNSGNLRGYYEALYLDNETPREEIVEIKQEYNLKLPNDIRMSNDWTKEEISASAANEMAQYLFNCKNVFDLTSNKPDMPLVFNHPVLFSYEIISEPSLAIRVIPRGGTGPFQVKIGANSESWIDVPGNSLDIGLIKGGGNNADGSYDVRVRDSRSPRVVSKIENIFT